MKRIIRDRRLTPAEIAKDREIRELIENEKPELSQAIRQRMMPQRKVNAPVPAEEGQQGTDRP